MHDDGLACYGHADVFLEDQVTVLGDWRADQQITLELAHDDGADVAVCEITSEHARYLAFRLLVLAEHADRRAQGCDR